MKKTMFKKVFAGIAAVFTLGLCVPTGFTGTDFKPSFETVAESGSGWTLENGVLTVSQGTTIKVAQFKRNALIKEVRIGDNCTILGNAFLECTALKSVEIGNNCTIEETVFRKCTALESVTIGNECTIGELAFWECTALTSVGIGNNCKIDKEAFLDCKSLKNVTIGDNCIFQFITTGKGRIMAGNTNKSEAFKNCTSLESITMGKECVFAELAFSNCTALKNVIFNGTCVEADKISVDSSNPEIITNKSKWKILGNKHIPDANYKCVICGAFDKAAAQAEIEKHKAEIDLIQKLIDENTTDEEGTASTFSDGSVLAVIGFSTFLILCGLAAVIIVKRRKKTEYGHAPKI